MLVDLLRQILFNWPLLLFAEAILVWISAEQVPSVQRVAPRYLKLRAGHTNIFTDVAHAVGHELALFCADFHSIHPFSVYESVAEVAEVAYGPATKGDECVVVTECFPHHPLWEQVRPDG